VAQSPFPFDLRDPNRNPQRSFVITLILVAVMLFYGIATMLFLVGVIAGEKNMVKMAAEDPIWQTVLRTGLSVVFAAGGLGVWKWRSWGLPIMWFVTISVGFFEFYFRIPLVGSLFLIAISIVLTVFYFNKRALFE
jgi:hypothetical protein